MDEAEIYFLFADRFGWTPAQVDEAPYLTAHNMLIIADERDRMNAEKQKAAT